jgi:hypothetical protein
MHKSEMQQREQLTTKIGGVCENASCGGDLDGVVQNCEIMAITQHALNKKTTLMHLTCCTM